MVDNSLRYVTYLCVCRSYQFCINKQFALCGAHQLRESACVQFLGVEAKRGYNSLPESTMAAFVITEPDPPGNAMAEQAN